MTICGRQRLIIIALYTLAILIGASTACMLWMSPTGTQQSGDDNKACTTQP